MMAQISFRIDDELKEKSEELFNSLGMNLSTALTIFIKQSLREGGIPFALTTKTDPFYSESNMRALRESIQDANNGKLTEHELIEN